MAKRPSLHLTADQTEALVEAARNAAQAGVASESESIQRAARATGAIMATRMLKAMALMKAGDFTLACTVIGMAGDEAREMSGLMGGYVSPLTLATAGSIESQGD